jgi:hypothetical protein
MRASCVPRILTIKFVPTRRHNDMNLHIARIYLVYENELNNTTSQIRELRSLVKGLERGIQEGGEKSLGRNRAGSNNSGFRCGVELLSSSLG